MTLKNKGKGGNVIAMKSYHYIIVGGGLTGAAATEGIREIDKEGSILLVGKEQDLPYDRPPLTKKLWFGQKKVEDIVLHNAAYYAEKNINLVLGREVTGLDKEAHAITDNKGSTYAYQKLLLATGGCPRKLSIPGGDLDDLFYYRYLDDYRKLRAMASPGMEAVIVGGGFIGAEIAAALNKNGLKVTIMFPGEYILSRIFPESLARAIEKDYRTRGISILSKTLPVSIEKRGDRCVTTTSNGKELVSPIVIVGIGIQPSLELARTAGLREENGIVVNEFLETSGEDIYAAGDNAFFPSHGLGTLMRIEHWDNAIAQGRHAGRTMAGAHEPYRYMPYFFSDLFDFGFEAVGTVDSGLEITTDWQVVNEKGIVWYLNNGKPAGVMMCNIWDRVESAREWISKGKKVELGEILGAHA
jgi:3-phenylpropionate/trans-cinnamate dioxygenase ferredoxin reductase component